MVFYPCFTCTTHIGLVAHRHSYQAPAACDYNEVGRTELSRRLPYSNRMQQLTNANHDSPKENNWSFSLRFHMGKKCFTNFTNNSACIHPGRLPSA
jgi:hypothetical protein